MGNPARKTYRAKRDSRRAQTFKLSLPGIVECPQCHEMKMAHRVCKNCGFYTMDCSPPGSSIHGILQANVLEWGAIAFSGLCRLTSLNSAGQARTLETEVRSNVAVLNLEVEFFPFQGILVFFHKAFC